MAVLAERSCATRQARWGRVCTVEGRNTMPKISYIGNTGTLEHEIVIHHVLIWLVEILLRASQ